MFIALYTCSRPVIPILCIYLGLHMYYIYAFIQYYVEYTRVFLSMHACGNFCWEPRKYSSLVHM